MYQYALCSELDSDEWIEKDVPEWVELIPPGSDIKGLDGREFTSNNAQAIVDEFNNLNRPMVVDYEHSTQLKGSKGEKAPAAGWINQLEVREDGSIWGSVEWVESAAESIKKKEYRYLSPVVTHAKGNKEILQIKSVALTNKPNLVMTALNSEVTQSRQIDFNNPEWQEVAQALNVESINNPNDILQALNYQEVEQLNKEYAGSVNELIKEGYIAPCEKDFYLSACRGSGYQEAMNRIEFIKSSRPAFGHLSKQLTKGKATTVKSNLTDSQKAVCREMGIKEQDYYQFVKGE